MMQLAAIFGALSIAATPAYATDMVVAWQQQSLWAFSPCGDAGSGDPHRHLLVPRPSRLEGATRRFGLLLEPKLLDEAKQQLRTDLLCYCDQDTLGLVKLVDRLLERYYGYYGGYHRSGYRRW